PRHEFVEGWHGAGLEPESRGILHGPANHLARCRRDGDEQPPGAGRPGDLRQLIEAAQHLRPAKDLVPLVAIVIEDADDPHPETVLRRAERTQDRRADIAGAIDERWHR